MKAQNTKNKKTVLKRLTYTEKTIIPKIILNKLRQTPNTLYKSNELMFYIQEQGYKIHPPTFRKIINLLRQQYYPITSTKNGYQYSTLTDDIDNTIDGLESRISAIKEAINGLKISKKILNIEFV